jgi:hypothetical protein
MSKWANNKLALLDSELNFVPQFQLVQHKLGNANASGIPYFYNTSFCNRIHKESLSV